MVGGHGGRGLHGGSTCRIQSSRGPPRVSREGGGGAFEGRGRAGGGQAGVDGPWPGLQGRWQMGGTVDRPGSRGEADTGLWLSPRRWGRRGPRGRPRGWDPQRHKLRGLLTSSFLLPQHPLMRVADLSNKNSGPADKRASPRRRGGIGVSRIWRGTHSCWETVRLPAWPVSFLAAPPQPGQASGVSPHAAAAPAHGWTVPSGGPMARRPGFVSWGRLAVGSRGLLTCRPRPVPAPRPDGASCPLSPS